MRLFRLAPFVVERAGFLAQRTACEAQRERVQVHKNPLQMGS